MYVTFVDSAPSPTEGAEQIKDAVLAMAYVPIQEYSAIYEEEKALNNGTLFKTLDKPFEAGAK